MMKGIFIAVFFCLLISSLFAEEISSAGTPINEKNIELISNTENVASICGDGYFFYDFTNSALCQPSFSAYIVFYSNGTFVIGSESAYGTWNSDGTVINWSYPPVYPNTLVTVYLGEISNGKMSGIIRSYVQECGCWSADISLTCTPNCLANYY